MIGWALRQLTILGAVALMLYAVAGYRIAHRSDPPPAAATAAAPAAPAAQAHSAAAPNSLTFRANKQGHVYLEAVVNGSPVRFVVDTGATLVVLTPADAAAAGIGSNDLTFRATMSTANGTARAAPVKLRELRVGQFAADDVPAVVMDHLTTSLLGQSFLRRLDSYEMRDGVLTLNWN